MTHYDVVIIGSGFGGSVSALRLSEKGYKVGVLEQGRRWKPEDFPETDWESRKAFWAPKLGCTGMQQITALHDTVALTSVGVGGGSLNYGNTLYEPLDGFFTDPQWAHITDWRAELAPYYDQAKRMLGAAQNPLVTSADTLLREVAEDMGAGETFHVTNVGVYFGEPGVTVDDPFFGGAGPERAGCVHCSHCFIGCKHNAKNTTETNYLYLAERAGAEIHPLTQVIAVRPRAHGGYEIAARDSIRPKGHIRKRTKVFTADQVVFSAASIGTQRLLHKFKDAGMLPNVSPRLGELTRTNSEAILVATARKRDDFARGVVITSSIHPEPTTHIEAFRRSAGSGAMFGMATPLVDGAEHRFRRWLLMNARHPGVLVGTMNLRKKAERSVLFLVMQSTDNSLTTYLKRGLFGKKMTTKQGRGEPNPLWIPVGHEVTRRFADKIDGYPQGTIGDVLNKPLTGHFLGGCVIGDSPDTGVVDPYHRLYGYEGLHVVDGSTITANLGVNPSLTITAQAERALSFWPNKGEPDSRPAIGLPYRRVEPVAPASPVVPSSAPGALRLPITPVRASS